MHRVAVVVAALGHAADLGVGGGCEAGVVHRDLRDDGEYDGGVDLSVVPDDDDRSTQIGRTAPSSGRRHRCLDAAHAAPVERAARWTARAEPAVAAGPDRGLLPRSRAARGAQARRAHSVVATARRRTRRGAHHRGGGVRPPGRGGLLRDPPRRRSVRGRYGDRRLPQRAAATCRPCAQGRAGAFVSPPRTPPGASPTHRRRTRCRSPPACRRSRSSPGATGPASARACFASVRPPRWPMAIRRACRSCASAIADYLGAARGIVCDPDQIVVVSGSQQGIDLTARVVAAPGDAVWFEEPGYGAARAALTAARLRVVLVPADAEGLDVAKRRGAGARCASRHGDAVVSLPAGRHAEPRPSPGAAGVGEGHRRMDPRGRLLRRVPLCRTSADAALRARPPCARALPRHLQQDAGAGPAPRLPGGAAASGAAPHRA